MIIEQTCYETDCRKCPFKNTIMLCNIAKNQDYNSFEEIIKLIEEDLKKVKK